MIYNIAGETRFNSCTNDIITLKKLLAYNEAARLLLLVIWSIFVDEICENSSESSHETIVTIGLIDT